MRLVKVKIFADPIKVPDGEVEVLDAEGILVEDLGEDGAAGASLVLNPGTPTPTHDAR